jgi:protein-S-isoprenylcysteine O-methyltransferase Ste14
LEELFFRVVFSVLWLIVLVTVTMVGYSAKRTARKQTTSHEGRLRVTALVFAAIYFGGALFYVLLPTWIMFLSIPLADWFRLIMVGVAVLGLLIVFWGYRVLGKNWAPSVSGVRKDTVLVTTGLYGFVRHPIYLGIFIFLWTLAIMTANLLVLLATLALLAVLYASIDEEEVILIDRFGDEYREYKKRTPRFIPKLS